MKTIIFCAVATLFMHVYASDKNNKVGIGADHGRNFGKEALEKVCDTVEKNKEGIAETTKDASQKFGSDAADKLGDAFKKAAVIVTVAQVGIKVVELGRDGYSYFYPSEKEKRSNERATQEYNLLKSEREFRECLTKNGKAKRDHDGVPLMCADQACNLAIAGGEEKLERLTKTFNKYYKQDKDF
jgi:hypothetical protein